MASKFFNSIKNAFVMEIQDETPTIEDSVNKTPQTNNIITSLLIQLLKLSS